MKPKVSVIVPIYHSEPYLDRCCHSLFKQTIESIEILFFIDGPSPSAKAIIEEVLVDYPKRKDSVCIIGHSENLGISHCRQEGHALAQGEFLYHCDSDDWLEPNALQLLVNEAERNDCDVVAFDYVRHYTHPERDVVYSSSGVDRKHISTINASLFNKLIRKCLIEEHQLRFPEGVNWGEDLYMATLCVVLARKVCYLPQVLYHCTMHDLSFTAQPNREKYMQLVSCPALIEEKLAAEGLKEEYAASLTLMKFQSISYFLIHRQLRDLPHWRTLYPECHSFIWSFGDQVPLYLRIVSWLTVKRIDWVALLLLDFREMINKFRY